ncbi:hypothetical protein [Gleimia europaea]|uniref:hypothetical protein n=1 Tax=Gleimia europaea TaxID=66228 RepID=UPI0011AECB1C|nr:hypothetical protein [Gleimia europaea]WIK63075.1 hypothetical protein CJ185_001820 [Gleimia europaea]WIK63211.1 hypothetical protein CJ185_002560 [Gleimia europaea]WIK63359.1 hypothetical protein CJ185_003380 [Gleimia europaea]
MVVVSTVLVVLPLGLFLRFFWIVFARTELLVITGFTLGWAVLVLCGLVWGHAVGFMANTVGLALPLFRCCLHWLLAGVWWFGGCGWVVGDLYSGCEHLFCLFCWVF